ncbi:polysaccharide deacetylase family protein [Aristaeella lactis]|uniref:Peptidoglycan/xylan/chitin deacetylase, PgdA/CDA1 family n=1 Tax=Aristaeella lactis TaxID=3046383 RepID=A0AC61PMF1_9FIRM|nr:polysaccharide deacetylase family protein [Aristaeella lactis]QUA53116.1 polysaccharide deacetylase family protein [Aristaeella lactis]SMC67754.1 Peptidoglycan/xylan/chitin deacetylase, PgdA/CDA1 family [Aristaeella lactis]
MTRLKKAGILLLILLICFMNMPVSGAESLRDCHRVTNKASVTTQKNKSQVKLWHVETAHPAVTEEINGIAQAWADELSPDLPKAGNNGKKNSRLDVEIRYSRTGLTWLSFLVQARTTYHQKLTAQQFTTRTYNMETGDRILLTDIFEDDDETWNMLGETVRQALTDYWPDVEPDAEALNKLCTREALEQADFTLHGMSLVLHYPAQTLYPDQYTLMDVTFFYPDIRDRMTEEGKTETDNLSYYRTCALTFDDGPSAKNTPGVLDALMETGARGTFFVVGNRIKENRWLVQREHDNGNAIGAHNWHHGNVTKSSGSALRAMPQKVNTAMIKSIGIPVRYDRVPGGRYPRMIEVKVGWAYIQWSLDTYDWRGISTAAVMRKVKNKLRDGDIILCHDIKNNTAESTRQIARYLEEEGYMLLTIDELFAKDGVKLEPNKVYYHCEQGDTSIRKD